MFITIETCGAKDGAYHGSGNGAYSSRDDRNNDTTAKDSVDCNINTASACHANIPVLDKCPHHIPPHPMQATI
eukprot:4060878-Pyramimonas_sp.AAC.1